LAFRTKKRDLVADKKAENGRFLATTFWGIVRGPLSTRVLVTSSIYGNRSYVKLGYGGGRHGTIAGKRRSLALGVLPLPLFIGELVYAACYARRPSLPRFTIPFFSLLCLICSPLSAPGISILTIFSRTSNLFGLLVDFECSNIDSTQIQMLL
jgi:hypothetical protein